MNSGILETLAENSVPGLRTHSTISCLVLPGLSLVLHLLLHGYEGLVSSWTTQEDLHFQTTAITLSQSLPFCAAN